MPHQHPQTISKTNLDQLFDQTTFDQKLAEATSPISVFKDTIKQGQSKLDESLLIDGDIKKLITGRASLIDQVLANAWQRFDWAHSEEKSEEISLIAVGGYGRGELHPHSDIDLLILLKHDNAEKYKEAIEGFLTLLWDINLEVGQSVRSITCCAEEADKDITVVTNLLESRTLIGPDTLRQEMKTAITTDKMWSSKDFFQAKWDEQQARHKKYNDTEYNLEPNIKGSPGGLRDIQMIGWVAKRHFGGTELYDLVNNNFLTQEEYDTLIKCQDFLWLIRYGLHMLSGRAEDRLLFDHQRALAKLFGYEDNDDKLAVEQFMQKYYRAVLAISELNDLLLQHFEEAILQSDDELQIQPINSRFQICNNDIEITHEKVFEQFPFALMELFVLIADTPAIVGVRASTIRAIRTHRSLIDENFRKDLRNISLFMELLKTRGHLVANLRLMKRYGVLGRYLPEFGAIIGQMQHDLFHIYTVDAHTLLVLSNMRKLRHPALRERFPIAARIIHHLPKIELLYIAGLYHDIAKGRGGNHSELGASDVINFCTIHRLGKWDTKLISWLVKQHLLMSVTAQKQDLDDPEVIREFALLVGDQIHLDYLYCLTIADINATNPELWTGWKASLLRQLYTETKRALRRGLETPVDKNEWIEETQQDALKILEAKGINLEETRSLWEQLGEDYFLRDSAYEVSWHTEAMLTHDETKGPLILILETTDQKYEGGTQVFICTKDQPNLFAATASCLDQLNLSIQDARIITSDSGFSLDTYIVLEESGEAIGHNHARIEQIKNALFEALDDPKDYDDIINRRTQRQMKSFRIPTEVTISNDAITQKTLIELISPDRPGLLARIGSIFLEFGLSLHNSKIATLGERVEDIFYVTDQEGRPLSDPELCQKLQQTICDQLDANVQKNN